MSSARRLRVVSPANPFAPRIFVVNALAWSLGLDG